MNYLFRPTPVVVLGCDRATDVVSLVKPPAGVMAGSPRPSGRPSRSLATQGAPWIVRSGTMASFGTLGQDDGFDFGGDVPFVDGGDFSGGGSGSDYSGAFASPNIPAAVPPDFPVAPVFSPLPAGVNPGILPVTVTVPLPPSGAGPTGRSIPGTQPANPAIAAGTSVLSTIANFLKPSTAPAKSLTLPAVGVNPNQPAPSFWATSTVVPGVPNATVILGGSAILLLLFALGSGGKK